MPTLIERLTAKVRYHQDRAHAYRIALDDLKAETNGHDVPPEADAPAKRRRAKAATPPAALPAVRGDVVQAAVAVLHQAKQPLPHVDLLERMQARLGRKLSPIALGAVSRMGYGKKTDEGWVATGKGLK